MNYKYCPDLTGTEEIAAITTTFGGIKRPFLNPCIGEKCVAYDHGLCLKYKNMVVLDTKEKENE